jgi:hypothetical protein
MNLNVTHLCALLRNSSASLSVVCIVIDRYTRIQACSATHLVPHVDNVGVLDMYVDITVIISSVYQMAYSYMKVNFSLYTAHVGLNVSRP